MSGRRSSYYDRAMLHSSARRRPLALPVCAPIIRSSHHHLADTSQCDMGLPSQFILLAVVTQHHVLAAEPVPAGPSSVQRAFCSN